MECCCFYPFPPILGQNKAAASHGVLLFFIHSHQYLARIKQLLHMECCFTWSVASHGVLLHMECCFAWSVASHGVLLHMECCCFYPFPPNNMTFPVFVEDLEKKKDISHIEMYYHQHHYEAIVSMESDQVCGVPLQLTGKDAPKRIDL